MQYNFIRKVAIFAAVLALFVVMLGAYTRLTDAGLGCPDWPGCYGHIVLPNSQSELQAAQSHYPEIPIEASKAWTEMAHRYAAGTLGILILMIAASVLWHRVKERKLPWRLPIALVFLLLFQAALGMWTVTLKLLPVVVMGHLLGGILIFCCLSRLSLQLSEIKSIEIATGRFWIWLGMVIVFCQIALGGWVSSNYAGIACIGFPQCNGQWLPTMHFTQGFNLLSPVGANYQGGILDNEVRVTIQFIHRIGAFITAAYLLSLSIWLLLKTKNKSINKLAKIIILLLLVQFALGIANVIYILPLGIAVAHNGVAALLLATLFMMLYLCPRSLKNAG